MHHSVEAVGEHDDVERSVDLAERPHAHLPIVPPVVHLLQHGTGEDAHRVGEIEPPLAAAYLALGLVPVEIHLA